MSSDFQPRKHLAQLLGCTTEQVLFFEHGMHSPSWFRIGDEIYTCGIDPPGPEWKEIIQAVPRVFGAPLPEGFLPGSIPEDEVLTVTVDLHSARTHLKTQEGVLVIANDGTGSHTVGNYKVQLLRKGTMKVARTGVVKEHHRLSESIWSLVSKAIQSTRRHHLPGQK